MFKDRTISLVISCRNEEKGLRLMFKNVPYVVDEVIVVDNNSTDRTAEVARQQGAKVIFEKNKGYGFAHKAGIAAAKGDLIVLVDGDNSYPLKELDKLLICAEEEGRRFVVGCRFPLVHIDAQPLTTTVGNYFISWLIRFLFWVEMKDSQSGMMLFEKSILKTITLEHNDRGFSQEIKIKAALQEWIHFGEVHITYRPRVGENKFEMKDARSNFRAVFYHWRNLILHKNLFLYKKSWFS